MAVRQLAGPFNLLDSNGDHPTNFVSSKVLWYPNVGLVCHIGNGIGRVTLDGVFCINSDFPGGYGALNHAYYGWCPDRNVMTFYERWTGIYALEAHTFCAFVDAEGSFLLPSTLHGGGVDMHGTYITLSDRKLFVHFLSGYAFIKAYYNGWSRYDDYTVECTLPLTFACSIGPGRTSSEVFISERGTYTGNTKFLFYDYVKKEVSSQVYHLGMSAKSVVYAPEYGVVVSVHGTAEDFSDYVVRVWSLENLPFTLSNPELYSGVVKSGRSVIYRVRVLGEHSDPCEGELVDWTISGKGRLLSFQSETDSDGYANVRVAYDVGDVGDSIVGASLLC